MNTDSFAPGSFCWADVATKDSAAAKSFYGSLFGWTAEDMPAGEGMTYSIMSLGGRTVCGLYQDPREGVRSRWDLYLSVPSADEIAAKAKELGASALMEPADVVEAGRMAALRDPTGAVFCVWQAKKHPGFGVVGEPGAYCWAELNTNDTAGAERFYCRLFDWGAKTSSFGTGSYTEFQRGDKAIAGMMAIQPEWGEVPPNWLVYFQVEKCDDSAAKAVGLGAKVLVPGTDVPGVGRFSVLQDPQGAVFAIVD